MKKCNLCFKKTSFVFLDLGKQPMANKYPANEYAFEKEKFFHVKVQFCSSCKNIQLNQLVSRDEMFKDYYYLSSVNEDLVRYCEDLARRKFSKSKFVVDIGSNDGVSLKPLKEMGVKYLGVDPSINVGKIANDAGLTTLVSFFDTKTANKIVKKYGKADVVTGLSMFSHLQDQHQFIEDVKTLMTDDGRFLVEVEYNALMLKNMAFERFYLDRVFYFSVTSFQKLFNMHGMYLQDAEVTSIHGGSLLVTAQKKGHGKIPHPRVKRLMEQEKKTLTPKTVRQFGKDAKMHVTNLKNKLIEYADKALNVIGYGAPARVSTITNFGGIGPELVNYIVDDSPLKQWRHSPGKHIPIVDRGFLDHAACDVLLVFAYDYFNDIRKKLKGKYTFLFPIPPREVK